MPRLNCTFDQFVEIIEKHGFVLHHPQGATSHRTYRGIVEGEVRIVIVAGHRGGDSIKPGTLSAMIRQTGLSKKLFRR